MTCECSRLDVEVFRAGDYGQKGRYGPEELEKIASDYDRALHEAPVTVDHAQLGPAHGWVEGVRRLGDRLVATLGRISPALAEWIRSGAYRKRSVELYRRFDATGRPYLKAVSFLGAGAPEVKGLSDPVFAETRMDGGSERAGDEGARDDVARFVEEMEGKEGDEREKAARETERARELRWRLDALRREGKIVPAWDRAGIGEFALALSGLEERVCVGGGEGDEGGKGESGGVREEGLRPAEWFLVFLERLPSQVSFGELAGPAGSDESGCAGVCAGVPACSSRARLDADSLERHRRVLAFRDVHPEATYGEALRRVVRGGM